jgi:hypothetical protein
MRHISGLSVLIFAVFVSEAVAQDPGSASYLLPACRHYLQSADQGQRLRLERGVCIGTIETVLRLHRELRAAYSFCPPDQMTLELAVRTVVEFTRGRRDLHRPLYALAVEAFQEKWPCGASAPQ